MGWGDELIASGQAREAHEADPYRRKVQIIDRNGNPRTSEIWTGNPRIALPEERGNFLKVTNGPHVRPYVAGKTDQRWYWCDFKCPPGNIHLTKSEIMFRDQAPAPQVVIEPHIKLKASPNKDWGWARWTAFVSLAVARGISVYQLGMPGMPFVRGAKWIRTHDFRYGCAVLSRAKAFVGHEGGLHHAAAALGVPAVVIFGGFISPAQTGYHTHRNLFTGGMPCGMRVSCTHCQEAMAAITPEEVLTNLEAIL